MILVTAGEMQEMDRLTIENQGIQGQELMENAGHGATLALLAQFGDPIKAGVGIICGKGNNGGDGFVIARYLAEKGINVGVYLLSKPRQRNALEFQRQQSAPGHVVGQKRTVFVEADAGVRIVGREIGLDRFRLRPGAAFVGR